MSEIRINTEEPDVLSLFELEELIDLDNVVITGNRDYKEYDEAPWWKEANEYISDMDCYGSDWDCFVNYEYNWDKLTTEQKDEIIKAYDKCTNSSDYRFIMQVVNILHPELKLHGCTIRGYCQRDWQDVVYVDGKIDVDYLESVYFGKVADVYIENGDDSYSDFITDDDLWEFERKGILKKELCKRYSLNPDDTQIYVSDGVTRSIKWKEVC